MSEYLVILFSAVFVENIVLAKLLGVYTLIGSSKNSKAANGMGLAVVLTAIAATVVSHPVQTYLLAPRGLEYLNLLVFFVIVAVMAKLAEKLLASYADSFAQAPGKLFAMVLTNSAVLGISILFSSRAYDFGQALAFAIGAALGYWLAIVVLCGVRGRIANSPIPAAFSGMPITLVAAALISLSFAGFSGVAEGLFK